MVIVSCVLDDVGYGELGFLYECLVIIDVWLECVLIYVDVPKISFFFKLTTHSKVQFENNT